MKSGIYPYPFAFGIQNLKGVIFHANYVRSIHRRNVYMLNQQSIQKLKLVGYGELNVKEVESSFRLWFEDRTK